MISCSPLFASRVTGGFDKKCKFHTQLCYIWNIVDFSPFIILFDAEHIIYNLSNVDSEKKAANSSTSSCKQKRCNSVMIDEEAEWVDESIIENSSNLDQVSQKTKKLEW